MATSMGIGVIGMGWMGQAHARSYISMPLRYPGSDLHPRLVACSDTDLERAESARATLGFDTASTDWQAVVDHPDVDVVNVAAPNAFHLEIVAAAAAAGKHVFCEKPVGRSPAETAAIAAAVRRAGVTSFVGFNYRWAPLVQHTKRLLDDGRLGTPTNYRGRFYSMYGSNPMGLLSWRFSRAAAGLGVLGDLMSHAVDMALYLNGPITSVVADQRTFIPNRPVPQPGRATHYALGTPDDPAGEVENEDYVGALARFANGSHGVLEASRTIFGPKSEMAFEVFGTNGAAAWNFEQLNELRLYLPTGERSHDGYVTLLGGPADPNHGNFVPGDGLGIGYEDLKVIEAHEFLTAVRDGTPGSPNIGDALAAAEVQEAMIRSAESGTWEDVPSLGEA